MRINHNYYPSFSNGKKHPAEIEFPLMWQHYRREWERRPLEQDCGEFPLFLDLDLSNTCNFACPTCSSTMHKELPKFMSNSTFTSIVNEAVLYPCYGIKLHTISRGEPMLHPELIEFITYAKRVKPKLIDVRMNTNGSLLTEKKIEALIDAGLDLLIVSMDGSTPEEYKQSGRIGDFDRIRDYIAMATAAKSRMLVRVQSINFPYIDQQRFVEHWSRYADEVAVIGYFEMRNRNRGEITKSWYCPDLYQRMSVLHDGTILPCNHDDNQRHTLGNVYGLSLQEAWTSLSMESLRHYHKTFNSHKLYLCQDCYYRSSAIRSER